MEVDVGKGLAMTVCVVFDIDPLLAWSSVSKYLASGPVVKVKARGNGLDWCGMRRLFMPRAWPFRPETQVG